MAKLEIPVVADISEIESLIDEIKHLQTYKLSYGDEQILIDRDDVIKIFAAHVRANIEPERKMGKWIKADTHNYLFFKNDRVYKCSCCRQLLDFEGVNGGRGDANFCPHCGAKMEETDERT